MMTRTVVTSRYHPGAQRTPLAMAWSRFRQNRMATLGSLTLVTICVIAIFSPAIAPYSPIRQDLPASLSPPSAHHWFGTDSLGRDLFSRVIFGARVSLSIALSSTLVALLGGVPVGLVAGWAGGRTDNVLMRAMDGLLCFPPIIMALALLGSFGPNMQNVILALAVVYLPVFARLTRGSTLVVKEQDFILAARTVGVSSSKIALRHILPNAVSPIIVQATVSFARAIILEAALSFLGLGTQPPTPSWGLDLQDGRRYVDQASWAVLGPGLAIVLTILAINFLGDGLRDALDPRVLGK